MDIDFDWGSSGAFFLLFGRFWLYFSKDPMTFLHLRRINVISAGWRLLMVSSMVDSRIVCTSSGSTIVLRPCSKMPFHFDSSSVDNRTVLDPLPFKDDKLSLEFRVLSWLLVWLDCADAVRGSELKQFPISNQSELKCSEGWSMGGEGGSELGLTSKRTSRKILFNWSGKSQWAIVPNDDQRLNW